MPRRGDHHKNFLDDLEQLISRIQSEQPQSRATSEQIASTYGDIFFSIRELAQRKQLPEESLVSLEIKIRDYLDLLWRRGDVSWDAAEYFDVIEIRDPSMEKRTIKVRVVLEEMQEPVVVTYAGEKHLASRMIFREPDGPEQIESTPTCNTPLINELQRDKRRHHVFDVLATVLLMPVSFGERFFLLVHDMKPSETALQMVMATQSEIDYATKTLAALQENGRGIFEYIYSTLVHGMGIQGLKSGSELRDSLEAVIIQAFSDNWIQNASGKLHTLIIGAPAVGKKLLVDAARMLNPVFYEAHPSKVTVAGICSTAVQHHGTWHSKPGYIPLAHRGVFAIQDFHSVKDRQREDLLGLFNMVMEEGQVTDATAAQQTHPALTSIHLDANKKTDLFPDSQLRGETIVAKRLDDIKIPMTNLSRFDFIIDIPRDTQRQMDIALAMYERPGHVVGTRVERYGQDEWARQLQVLVALLRTKHRNITFSPDIVGIMRSRHDALFQSNAALYTKLPWLGDFQTRLTNSVFKFVASYARMSDRDEPHVEDVDRSFRLIGRKFDFLATLSQALQVPSTWEVPQRENLDSWLCERFAGEQVNTGDILAAYQAEYTLPLGRRTLERHLPKVARSIKFGVWEFPGSPNTAQGTVYYADFECHDLPGDLTFWAGSVPETLLFTEAAFESLWSVHPRDYREVRINGRVRKMRCWQQAYIYDYSYSGQTNRALALPDLLFPLLDWVQHEIDGRLNGLLVNWYDGKLGHCLGQHQDSTTGLVEGAPIVTISFGEERVWRLRPCNDTGRRDFIACNGCVFVMPYDTNLAWKHEVPHQKRFQGRRISVTFRAFSLV